MDWKRNEAAIIIQRNLAKKHQDELRLARLTLISLRSFRKLCLLVEDEILNNYFEEIFSQVLDQHIKMIHQKWEPALNRAESICITSEMDAAIDIVVLEYVLKFIEEENRRLAEERRILEEQMRMAAEDLLEVIREQRIEQMKAEQKKKEELQKLKFAEEERKVNEEMAKVLIDDVISECSQKESTLQEEKETEIEQSYQEDFDKDEANKEQVVTEVVNPRPVSPSEFFVDQTFKAALDNVTKSFAVPNEEVKTIESPKPEIIEHPANIESSPRVDTPIIEQPFEELAGIIEGIALNVSFNAIQSALAAVVPENKEPKKQANKTAEDIPSKTEDKEENIEETNTDLPSSVQIDVENPIVEEEPSPLDDQSQFEEKKFNDDEEEREPQIIADMVTHYAQEAEKNEDQRNVHQTLSENEGSAQPSIEAVKKQESLRSLLSEEESVETIVAVSKSANQVRKSLESISRGKFDSALNEIEESIELLDRTLNHVSNHPTLDPAIKIPKISMVKNILLLLKARAIHNVGKFVEAKVLLDQVLQDRISLLNEAHYLVGEVYFYIAEWYRSVGLYHDAEQYHLVSDRILVEALKKEDDSGDADDAREIKAEEADDEKSKNTKDSATKISKTDILSDYQAQNHFGTGIGVVPSIMTQSPLKDGVTIGSVPNKTVSANQRPSYYTVYKLYHRNLIAYTEVLRSAGQYYKAFDLMKRIQQSLLQYKQIGLQSFEVKEEFLSHYLTILTLQGQYSLAISLHQELLDKRRIHYGNEHFKVATSYYCLGKLLLLKAQYEESIHFIEQSLEMRSNLYPNHFIPHPQAPETHEMMITHPSIAKSTLLKSEGFVLLGNYEIGLREAVKALEIYQSLFISINPKHTSIVICLQWIYYIIYLIGEPKISFHGLTAVIQQSSLSAPMMPSLSMMTSTSSNIVNEAHLVTLRMNYSIAQDYLVCGNVTSARDLLSLISEKYEFFLQQIRGKNSFLPSEEPSLTLPHVTSYGRLSTPKHSAEPSSSEKKKKTVDGQDVVEIVISPIEFESIQFDYLTAHHFHTLSMTDLSKHYRRMIRRMNLIYQQTPNLGTARFLYTFAEWSKLRGNYLDAKQFLTIAYDMIASLHGELHPLMVAVMSEQGDGLRVPGFYTEAMLMNSYALKLAYALYPKNNDDLLASLSLLPPQYQQSSNRSPTHLSSLGKDKMQEHINGEIMQEILFIIHNIHVHESIEDHPLIQTLMKTVKSGSLPFHLIENIHIMKIFHHRIALYRDLGDYNKAELFSLYVIHYYLNHFLNNTGTYALALLLLADVYRLQGRYRLSKGILLKSLKLIEQFYSKQSVYYAEAMMYYCLLLMDAHQWQQSMQYWVQEVLPLIESISQGKHHPYYYYSRMNFTINRFYLDNQSIFLNNVSVVNSSDEGGSGVMSGFNVDGMQKNNNLLADFIHQNEDVRNFLQFCDKSGFTSNHPWRLRLSMQLSDCRYYLDPNMTTQFSQSMTVQESSLDIDDGDGEGGEDDEEGSVASSFVRRQRENKANESEEGDFGYKLPERSDDYRDYRKKVLHGIRERDADDDDGSWVSDSASQSQSNYLTNSLQEGTGTGTPFESRASTHREQSEHLSSNYSPRVREEGSGVERQRSGVAYSPTQSHYSRDESISYYSGKSSSLPSVITHSTDLNSRLKNAEASNILTERTDYSSYHSPSPPRTDRSRRKKNKGGSGKKRDVTEGEYEEEAYDEDYEGSRSLVGENSQEILSLEEFRLQRHGLITEPSEITYEGSEER